MQQRKRGDRSRPKLIRQNSLCRLLVNRAANLVASLFIDGHVVLLTTVLFDLRHDLLFTVAGHMPITVLRPHVGAFEIDFTFVPLLRVRTLGFIFVLLPDMLRSLRTRSNTLITLVTHYFKDTRLVIKMALDATPK